MSRVVDVQQRSASFVPYLVLAAGVLAASSASILIRLAQDIGVSSTTIAAGRLMFAALFLLPIALVRVGGELRAIQRQDLLLGGASGVILALHFLAWISSLEYTSVASSAALVATNPLWVALATLLLFRERLSGATWLGIALTICGAALIAFSDGTGENGANALFGNGLALLGAVAGSAYFLIGRTLRRRLSTLAYIWLVYSVAALVLLCVALAVGWGDGGADGALQGMLGDGNTGAEGGHGGAALLGVPVMGYVLMLGLAIGPQLIGHTSFNWALRYLSATFVALAILGEPIGSALLALVLFNESFEQLQLVGFLLLLVGIAVAARAEE